MVTRKSRLAVLAPEAELESRELRSCRLSAARRSKNSRSSDSSVVEVPARRGSREKPSLSPPHCCTPSRAPSKAEIGRASCSERVCPYVYIAVVGVALKNMHILTNHYTFHFSHSTL